MAVDHFVGKAQLDTEFAHFILKERTQRFEKLQVKRFGQTAHIVVALDGLGLLGLGPGRFDDVRIDGALSKPLGV